MAAVVGSVGAVGAWAFGSVMVSEGGKRECSASMYRIFECQIGVRPRWRGFKNGGVTKE